MRFLRLRRAHLAFRFVPAVVASLITLTIESQTGTLIMQRTAAQEAVPYTDAGGDELRRQLCSGCHMVPPPDALPRGRWRDTVARMWLRRDNKPEPQQRGGAALLRLPDEFARVSRWYTEHAPPAFPPAESWPAEGDGPPNFRKHYFSPPTMPPVPAVSNVQFVDLAGDARLEVLACDMRYGMVIKLQPYEPEAPVVTLAQLNNAAHAAVVDLDADGVRDLLVAELGDFLPTDHAKGAVVWLRGRADGTFVPFDIGGLPRVADVEAADMNGDGRLDLVVAAFGWRKAGQTMLLVNRTTDYARPSFEAQTLDGRSGAIHAIPTDLDGDKDLDLIVLIAQQHEQVLAFYNNGPGAGLAMKTLYAAPHPNWGFSGMQLIDVDGDNDLDVLLSHGDTLDDNIIKPYHGIQWLENKGGYAMEEHTLSTMPGVHRAIVTDLDGDGDRDVLASAMVAFDAGGAEKELASIGWLEQVGPATYVKRTLEMGRPRHPTIDAADYDRDGDIDIVVGNFAVAERQAPWIEVWENVTIDGSAAPARRAVERSGR
jgi:hypothetical protein